MKIEKNLDVWVAQTLVDAERCTLFDGLLVLVDLACCKFSDKVETGLDACNILCLEVTGCNSLGPDVLSLLCADKDCAPSVGAAD